MSCMWHSGVQSCATMNGLNSLPTNIETSIVCSGIDDMKYHGFRGRSSVVSSLFAAASLLHGCIATNSNPQRVLHEINPTSSLKWETCGDLSNHTLECEQNDILVCIGLTARQAPALMFQWITPANPQTRHSLSPSLECLLPMRLKMETRLFFSTRVAQEVRSFHQRRRQYLISHRQRAKFPP